MSEISRHGPTNQDDHCANQNEQNFKHLASNSRNFKDKTLKTAFLSDIQEKEPCEIIDGSMSEEEIESDLEPNPSNAIFEETASFYNYSLISYNSETDDKNNDDNLKNNKDTVIEDDTDSGDETENEDDIDSGDSRDREDDTYSEDETDSEDDTVTNNDKNKITKTSSGAPIQNLKFQDNVVESEGSETENDNINSRIAETCNALKRLGVPKKHKRKRSSWLSEECLEIPDIFSLDLTDEVDFLHMGKIDFILKVDGILVYVVPFSNMPAYDLNTLFFLDEGKKVLGYSWDVMGHIKSPTYIFKVDEEIMERLSIKKGLNVYCAPKSKYTTLVPVKKLMKCVKM